jgi:spore photoproduct lyase
MPFRGLCKALISPQFWIKVLRIRTLYIDPEVRTNPLCREIRERLDAATEYTATADAVFKSVASKPDPVAAGKETLFLTRNKGAFIRPCPGTRYYTCCNYRILHIGAFCTMDCAYCILQAYFHPPLLTYYVNQDEMGKALEEAFSSCRIRRIGTGEFTDSLIWESIDPISRRLIQKFACQEQAVLELKTKTVCVDHLLDLPHNRKTIMAWSLNTERVIAGQERGTAGLSARLRAARRCQRHGYPLAFHFDPVVLYPGCEIEYQKVLNQLFDAVDPSGIVWISLGSFRFMPELKPVVERRFPESKIVYGEFVKGMDGKMRYFKPLRLRLYRRLADSLRQGAPSAAVYFCMEDDEAWRKVFGFSPQEEGGLPNMLDKAAVRHCGLQ